MLPHVLDFFFEGGQLVSLLYTIKEMCLGVRRPSQPSGSVYERSCP